ncbi:tRNA (adenosine(37)-N6)-threonylcarbamoyltransferase complex dimerization subunit type 1 TsaB [Entomomonas sp. E2T0]|uniref:tRNA (adenosine(37)-N6)-threonylcarbamoyltransferase complex dimerization subunit type 1 TsaB n=1 Tax=Entomomonas sp. E2T0 TaxID=2930213 RepID=UPI00222832FA|nr:tRNA (adenosine(37)-N6)-threonylcarbamoyltransferase complex dimerization subunit type 1 TsaB [Entomomonas sp. E2T0]UYZ84984.1 tRNA (adenosine(37)-N6)-threonylcarbamoyltransferase complex dimerization subunit type 1 TsaB [Entomomonas sp. E2T0]
MTTLLAIDTATEACSVAILHQGELYTCYEVIPRLHAQQILPMIKKVVAEAGCSLSTIDGLAFGRGPGAFTGVRIATGVIQGLAFALDKPVIAISDLAVLAQRAWREYKVEQVAVAIDARMNEIYWGCYQLQQKEMCLIGMEQVLAPEQAQLPEINKNWFGVGTGWKYAKQIPVQYEVINDGLFPDAKDLLALAELAWQRNEMIPAEKVEPVYLRDNVATPKKNVI